MGDSISLSCTENIAVFHLLHAGRAKERTLASHSVPSPPTVSPKKALPAHRKDYALSFKRERSLAGALAYISNTTGDINRVPAICIEEDHHTRRKWSLQVLLAVNKCESKDGDKLLQTIRSDFENIFAVLSRVVDNSDDQSGIEHELRRLIVAMCSERILSRLNLKKRKNRTPKQPAKEKFENAIRALTPHGAIKVPELVNISDEVKSLFLDGAKEITRLLDAWIYHPKAKQLEDLVLGFYRLGKLDCQAVVNAIPEYEMDTATKGSLTNMISKVCRYGEVARFLFRTAKKFPIVRRVKVIPVDLPHSAFVKTSLDPEYQLSLSSKLSKIFSTQQTSLAIQSSLAGDIYSLLDTTPQEAGDDLTAQVYKTVTTGKLHAEVQLISHCEKLQLFNGLNNEMLPPRIVCSSKEACFLCNLLVSMHGMMRTPWSHGKLYPGWRLPDCVGKNLQLKFNHHLEEQIRDSIELLVKRRGKTSYPGPSESTLITLPSLASEPGTAGLPSDNGKVQSSHAKSTGKDQESPNGNTQVMGDDGESKSSSDALTSVDSATSVTGRSSVVAHESDESGSESEQSESDHLWPAENIQEGEEGDSTQAEPVAQNRPIQKESKEVAQSAQSTSSSKVSDDGSPVEYSDHPEKDKSLRETVEDHTGFTDAEEPSLSSPKTCEDRSNSLEEYHHLREGQKLTLTILQDHMKTFFTRTLMVEVEYSTGTSPKIETEGQPRKITLSIGRLGADEVKKLKDDGTIPFGKAEAIIGKVPLVLPSMEHIFIAARGSVFKITFH